MSMASTKRDHLGRPISITPSGFFGKDISNIVEIPDFLTQDEIDRLRDFAYNNKIWDVTESTYDVDGLITYDHTVWENRVCTTGSLLEADKELFGLLEVLYERLRPHVEKKFSVKLQPTGPAIVRWRVGDRQEPHADKEFHIGEEKGRSNNFPHFDIASLYYYADEYEGGELYFPHQGIEFKPKVGSAYFFPGDMNYVHGVRPVKSGLRCTAPFFWTITEHTGDKQP